MRCDRAGCSTGRHGGCQGDLKGRADHWDSDVDTLLMGVATALDSPRAPYLTRLVAQGGRRFRRRLVLEAAHAGGGLPVRGIVVRLAAGVEMLHLASLIHDDYADGARERRGVPSMRDWLGDESFLLLGLGCAVEAAKLVAEAGHAFAVAFTAGAKRLAQGQLNDVDRADDDDLLLDEYVAMVGEKTGSLLSTAAVLGATAGRPRVGSDLAVLDSVGTNLGIAFQVADDLEDLHGLTQGKPPGVDEANGRRLSALKDSAHGGLVASDALVELAHSRLERAKADWQSTFGEPPRPGCVLDDVADRLAAVAQCAQ